MFQKPSECNTTHQQVLPNGAFTPNVFRTSGVSDLRSKCVEARQGPVVARRDLNRQERPTCPTNRKIMARAIFTCLMHLTVSKMSAVCRQSAHTSNLKRWIRF